jgi:K+-transporting ATPase ATPase A chain
MSPSTKFWLLAAILMVIVVLCIKPLGTYIAGVMEGQSRIARLGRRFERRLYRICGIDTQVEMSWAQYAVALLVFNVIGTVIVYGLQRLQAWLPLNPQKMTAVTADSSFNTAVSFVTWCKWPAWPCRISCPRRADWWWRSS